MGGKRRTKFSMLNWNLWHTWEHYGNIIVYLRMKGLVPPSSERTGMKMPWLSRSPEIVCAGGCLYKIR